MQLVANSDTLNMKIVVSSPFRNGNSWLVCLLCRSLSYQKADFGVVTPAALDNLTDNTVVRTNFLINSTNIGGAIGIRLLRNIPDSVAAKLIYGVNNYLTSNASISVVFRAYLDAIAAHSTEWRTPKNCVELAIEDHIQLINQFCRENLEHHLASTEGVTVVSYEDLCHDAGKWVKDFADAHELNCIHAPWQVNVNIAPGASPNGPTDIVVANWCASTLSVESNRRLNTRIVAIREQMLISH